MKKLLFLLLMLCAVFLFAKTEIPVMQKVAVHKAKVTKSNNKSQPNRQPANNTAEGQQEPISPLDEPFNPKHVYSGTNISKNVIPIQMVNPNKGEAICSAFRFHKNWILTAAHCMEVAVEKTNNQRIYSSVEKQDNGLIVVVFAPADKDHPANANVYFYKQGYTSDEHTSYGKSPYGHSDDIALVRLDTTDTSIPKAQANMTRAVREAKQAQAQLEQLLPEDSPLLDNTKQANRLLQKEQKRLSTKQKVRKDFLNQPLDDYHFFVLNPVQTPELNGRSAITVRFKEKGEHSLERNFPDSFVWKYKGLRHGANHNVGWTFNDISVHESGSPLIINGFVISNASGPTGKDTRETPLYTERFHQFLVESMGTEYPKGICVQPVSAEPLPIYEPKK